MLRSSENCSSRVGSADEYIGRILEQLGFGEQYDNGDRLATFADLNRLVVNNAPL